MTELSEDDVALKLLHTADWHLGKRFPSFSEFDQLKLTRARLEVVDNILNVAEHRAVDAVVAAGDLFDAPDPHTDWYEGLARVLEKRNWSERPLVLLPGNHDPLTETSVYSSRHPFRSLLPAWVHVVDRDDFALELRNEAVIVARPCHRQAGEDDNAMLLPAREAGDTRIRIGLVHGSTFDMPGFQTNFPISQDAAVERGLDYLAIGDTHAWRVYPPEAAPTVYPGAPEQTSFGEQDTGHVAIVLFRRQGRRPRIQQESVARWLWRADTVREMSALRALRDEPKLDRTVLRLRLQMHVTAEEYAEVERVLGELAGSEAAHGRVGVLQVDRSRLELDTRDIENLFEDLPAVVQAAARRLKDQEGGEKGEVARRALYHLFRVSRGLSAP